MMKSTKMQRFQKNNILANFGVGDSLKLICQYIAHNIWPMYCVQHYNYIVGLCVGGSKRKSVLYMP